MPRKRRIVIPHHPHHLTQRGSHRQDVFFNHADYELYLELLKHFGNKYGTELLGYCLMTNHVHHLMVPHEKDSLRWTLQLAHKRYAEFINTRNRWRGHLWQERFYSCPVDEEYLWITLKYIERNPVAASMVTRASDYEWSSAAAHCGLRNDQMLTEDKRWVDLFRERKDWSDWLSQPSPAEKLKRLREATARDLPCGSDDFLDRIERDYGVRTRLGKAGRPKKSSK